MRNDKILVLDHSEENARDNRLVILLLTLILVESIPPSPVDFPSLNSETVKAVTLAFCSIQYDFIRNIRAKFGIPNMPQSPDIEQNSGMSISNFRILVNPPHRKANPRKPTQIMINHWCYGVIWVNHLAN